MHGIGAILFTDGISNRLRSHVYSLPAGRNFGRNVAISSGVYINVGQLTLGDNVFINQRCYFDLSAEIAIGRNVKVGSGVSFVTTHHDIGQPNLRCGEAAPRPISVGDGAWIGTNALILGGCCVGNGAVVAAGAVVTKDVPPNTLFGGVPARHLRDLPT